MSGEAPANPPPQPTIGARPPAHDIDGDPLPTAASPPPPLHPPPQITRVAATHDLPLRIDNYRIIRRLGAGGMGVVFEAEQHNPRRLVALKVINAGIASREAMRRFQHEAQVLGRLQHVGIAQIYEAGTFDTGEGGRPFFAMELVRGKPITQFASERGLAAEQRLELLAKVCDAVQHAHLKAIIHRDLKPGNILVTSDGQPKVLDFGVARATDSDVRATTIQTRADQLIGTLPYMSPEQALGDSNELDIRSDVYALGVIGYELLTARLPYNVDHRTVFEAVRVIREEEPTRLSTLDRRLRGDVETIIGKALEKDRARRYQSAADLAADIRRFLNNEPIVARPASVSYRVAKFARRHMALVIGLCAVVLVLIAGVIASTTFALRENRARIAAQQQSTRAQALLDFHRTMLSRANPAFTGGRDVTVREALDHAAGDVGTMFPDQPDLEASIRATIGESYTALSEFHDAAIHFERAAALFNRSLGEDHPTTLSAQANLAVALHDLGRLDEAIDLNRRVLKRRQAVLGADHPDTISSEVNLALALKSAGHSTEAEALLRSAVDRAARISGEGSRVHLTALGGLASLMREKGRLDEAVALYAATIELSRRTLGDDDHDTLATIDNYAITLQMLGQHDRALELMRDQLQRTQRVFGPTHASTLIGKNNLATALQNAGQLDEAETLFREFIEHGRMRFGDSHPDVLLAMRNLAILLYVRGESAQAETMLNEAVDAQLRRLGEHHPHTIATMGTLALVLTMQNKFEQAAPWHRRALEATRTALGPEHPDTLSMEAEFASFLRDLGRFDEARPLYIHALAGLRRVRGDDAEPTLTVMYQYLGLLQQSQLWDEALPLSEELLRRSPALSATSPFGMLTPMRVGITMAGVGRFSEAEELLLESLRRLEAVDGSNPDWHARVMDELVKLYERWSRPGDAALWRERLAALRAERDSS